MKKYPLLFVLCVCFLSCSGTSDIIKPLMLRTVEVENTTSLSINITVYTVHNSGLSFSGVINSGEKKTFSNVSECNIKPKSSYNWKLEQSYDKNGYQRFKFRDLTPAEEENEKLKVTVWNTNVAPDVKLKYKVKEPGAVFETTPPIKNGLGILIKLYDTDYEFELDNPPVLPPEQKYDIIYDKAAKRINITQVPTE